MENPQSFGTGTQWSPLDDPSPASSHPNRGSEGIGGSAGGASHTLSDAQDHHTRDRTTVPPTEAAWANNSPFSSGQQPILPTKTHNIPNGFDATLQMRDPRFGEWPNQPADHLYHRSTLKSANYQSDHSYHRSTLEGANYQSHLDQAGPVSALPPSRSREQPAAGAYSGRGRDLTGYELAPQHQQPVLPMTRYREVGVIGGGYPQSAPVSLGSTPVQQPPLAQPPYPAPIQMNVQRPSVDNSFYLSRANGVPRHVVPTLVPPNPTSSTTQMAPFNQAPPVLLAHSQQGLHPSLSFPPLTGPVVGVAGGASWHREPSAAESTQSILLAPGQAPPGGDGYAPLAPGVTPSGTPYNFGEHPFGEHPSRTLFVRNINSCVEDDELYSVFQMHGPVRSMYTACKHRGFVMVSYYDIRHSKSAMRYLQGKVVRRRKIDIHYSIPKDNPSERDQNQGTLVVFNLDPCTSNDELRHVFSAYGEIKEIRETPNKRHHKFIEYYDIRDAERAMKVLNRTEIRGKRIKIEPSRPGGTRKSQPSSQQSGQSAPSPYVSAHASPNLQPQPPLVVYSSHSDQQTPSSQRLFTGVPVPPAPPVSPGVLRAGYYGGPVPGGTPHLQVDELAPYSTKSSKSSSEFGSGSLAPETPSFPLSAHTTPGASGRTSPNPQQHDIYARRSASDQPRDSGEFPRARPGYYVDYPSADELEKCGVGLANMQPLQDALPGTGDQYGMRPAAAPQYGPGYPSHQRQLPTGPDYLEETQVPGPQFYGHTLAGGPPPQPSGPASHLAQQQDHYPQTADQRQTPAATAHDQSSRHAHTALPMHSSVGRPLYQNHPLDAAAPTPGTGSDPCLHSGPDLMTENGRTRGQSLSAPSSPSTRKLEEVDASYVFNRWDGQMTALAVPPDMPKELRSSGLYQDNETDFHPPRTTTHVLVRNDHLHSGAGFHSPVPGSHNFVQGTENEQEDF